MSINIYWYINLPQGAEGIKEHNKNHHPVAVHQEKSETASIAIYIYIYIYIY